MRRVLNSLRMCQLQHDLPIIELIMLLLSKLSVFFSLHKRIYVEGRDYQLAIRGAFPESQ